MPDRTRDEEVTAQRELIDRLINEMEAVPGRVESIEWETMSMPDSASEPRVPRVPSENTWRYTPRHEYQPIPTIERVPQPPVEMIPQPPVEMIPQPSPVPIERTPRQLRGDVPCYDRPCFYSPNGCSPCYQNEYVCELYGAGELDRYLRCPECNGYMDRLIYTQEVGGEYKGGEHIVTEESTGVRSYSCPKCGKLLAEDADDAKELLKGVEDEQ